MRHKSRRARERSSRRLNNDFGWSVSCLTTRETGNRREACESPNYERKKQTIEDFHHQSLNWNQSRIKFGYGSADWPRVAQASIVLLLTSVPLNDLVALLSSPSPLRGGVSTGLQAVSARVITTTLASGLLNSRPSILHPTSQSLRNYWRETNLQPKSRPSPKVGLRHRSSSQALTAVIPRRGIQVGFRGSFG